MGLDLTSRGRTSPPPLPSARRGRRAVLRVALWRARLPIAACGLALAAVAAMHALRPVADGQVDVMVAARDLAAGTTLRDGDLRVEAVPTAVAPATARVDRTALVGRSTAVAVAAGTMLVDGVLGGAPRGPAGTVVATVRLADAQAAALLRPGDHVDLVAADGTGPATTVAARALVLPGPAQSGSGTLGLCSGGSEESTAVVVAVSPTEALAIAAATQADLSAFVVT